MQRNAMPETKENLAEAAIHLFPYYQTVILPALKAQLVALLSEGLEAAITSILETFDDVKLFALALRDTQPTVDGRIIRGNMECGH